MLLSQVCLRHCQGTAILLLTLLLYTLPRVLTKIRRIEIPSLFEGFIVCFIFSAMILGEISNFYTIFRLWDTALIGRHNKMKDLLVKPLGALVFSAFVYFYELTNMNRFKFIRYFVLRKQGGT